MDSNKQCPEFPFFGASYPDARCIDGYLWDLDKVNEKGEFYGEGETPCPFCNTKAFIEYDPFSIADWASELEPYEFIKTKEGAEYMEKRVNQVRDEWYDRWLQNIKNKCG